MEKKKLYLIGGGIFLVLIILGLIIIKMNKKDYQEVKIALTSQVRTLESIENSKKYDEQRVECTKIIKQMNSDMKSVNCKSVEKSYQSECSRLQELTQNWEKTNTDGIDTGILYTSKLPDNEKDKKILYGWVDIKNDIKVILNIK